jgi:nucleotide-binding universal stress UspA family protein
MINLKRILVPSDFSECSDAAVRYGLEFAHKFGATLHLLHVVQDPATQPWAAEGVVVPLLEAVEEWQNEARLRLEQSIPADDRATARTSCTIASPVPEIVRYAKENEIDLIVMGTHGRTGVSHMFLGSVAERIVRNAPCPVLTVRHPEREFVEPAIEAGVQVCAIASAM